MAKHEEHIFEAALAALSEDELIEHSKHKKRERAMLYLRNGAVALAALLFVCSFALHEASHLLRAAGYFCGMQAYLFELLLLTDCFTEKISHHEAFMVYCFGPLYLLMAIGYLLE